MSKGERPKGGVRGAHNERSGRACIQKSYGCHIVIPEGTTGLEFWIFCQRSASRSNSHVQLSSLTPVLPPKIINHLPPGGKVSQRAACPQAPRGAAEYCE